MSTIPLLRPLYEDGHRVHEPTTQRIDQTSKEQNLALFLLSFKCKRLGNEA